MTATPPITAECIDDTIAVAVDESGKKYYFSAGSTSLAAKLADGSLRLASDQGAERDALRAQLPTSAAPRAASATASRSGESSGTGDAGVS